MSDQDTLQRLREQIADTVAQRDALKHAIEQQTIATRQGLRELEVVDARLSRLDTQFKALWDATRTPSPSD